MESKTHVGDGIAAFRPKRFLQEMRDRRVRFSIWWEHPKAKSKQYEKKWLDLPWQKVRESVDVKMFEQDGELICVGQRVKEEEPKKPPCAQTSGPFAQKARAMRRSLPFSGSSC